MRVIVEQDKDGLSRRAAQMVAELVRRKPRCVLGMATGTTPADDVLALGVWDAIQQRGLVPGRDVSVAGFDDLPDAEFIGLTSVHQPIAEKGRLAGRLAMDPDYPQQQILLPIELKVRTSTGPVPLTTL